MDDDRYFARKRPRQARSRALVDAVIAAAGRILPQRDPDETTTHDIAERAGVSIGSLYQYFPTKEAIFGALIDRKLAEDVGAARRWLEEHEGSADEAIDMLVDRLVALHRDARPLYRVMLPLVARLRRHARVRRAVAEVRAAVRERLERQRPELRKDDLDLAAFVSGHALEACLHAAVDERPELLDDPRFASELKDLLRRYWLA